MSPLIVPTSPSLNKAPLYLVCVLSKVKGESSDVNIQFFVVAKSCLLGQEEGGKVTGDDP